MPQPSTRTSFYISSDSQRAASSPNRRNGFTIVELLIVIVVIAILASITVVAYSGVQNRTRDVVLQSDLQQASSQLALDGLSGKYPQTEDQANHGKGLPKSTGTQYDYRSDGYSYCLTASSERPGVGPFHVTSDGTVTKGACPVDDGHNAPIGVPGAPVFSRSFNFFGGEGYMAWSNPTITGDSALTGFTVRIVSTQCAELNTTFSLPTLADGGSMSGSGTGSQPFYTFDRSVQGEYLLGSTITACPTLNGTPAGGALAKAFVSAKNAQGSGPELELSVYGWWAQ